MARTNIDLDDKLLEIGFSLTEYKTKKALVNAALSDFVRRIRRKGLLELAGTNCWEGNLDRMRKSRI